MGLLDARENFRLPLALGISLYLTDVGASIHGVGQERTTAALRAKIGGLAT
jgi:hypothetical protein